MIHLLFWYAWVLSVWACDGDKLFNYLDDLTEKARTRGTATHFIAFTLGWAVWLTVVAFMPLGLVGYLVWVTA